LQHFDAVLETLQVDEVVVTLPMRSFYEQIHRIVETCETQGITVHLLSHFFPLKIARVHVTEFAGMPLLTFRTGALSSWHAGLKRGFDIAVSAGLLLVLAPLFLLIALLIKVSSPDGPIFFVQTRVGYNRRHFKMVKFRTMVPDAEERQKELERLNEAQGAVFKIKHDPRVTALGRFLRKTSIDELPQLLNVLKGDMSLVGPRPLPLRDAARFDEKWLQRRWSVKPGLTCLWQVNGRQHDNFHAWIQQDLAYIDQWSFGLDLKILAKTIPAVLRGDGAH
jgi:exopolysaccharide biosynthesis polyprenyl glycosylphosphotransferase